MGADSSITDYNHLVLFDGVCVFCNSSVDFILQKEKDDTLMFTPLQSKLGIEILKQYDYPVDYQDSILFLVDGKLLNKSSAALMIAGYLKSPYSWLRFFKIVPGFIRNAVYSLIAKNRYRIFGKFDACMVPSPQLRRRFL